MCPAGYLHASDALKSSADVKSATAYQNIQGSLLCDFCCCFTSVQLLRTQNLDSQGNNRSLSDIHEHRLPHQFNVSVYYFPSVHLPFPFL